MSDPKKVDPKKVDPKKPEIKVPSQLVIHDRQQRLIKYLIKREKIHNQDDENIKTLFDNEKIQDKYDSDFSKMIIKEFEYLDEYHEKLEERIQTQNQMIFSMYSMILRMNPYR